MIQLEAIRTAEFGKMKISVYQDELAESPRHWDNLWTLVLLGYPGDEIYPGGDFLDTALCLQQAGNLVVPIYHLSHGHASFRTTPHRFQEFGWYAVFDSGCVGYAVVSKQKILKEYGKKRITPKTRALALAALEDEIKTFEAWVNGAVYCYVITDSETGETVDSCGGFFDPPDYVLKTAQEVL